MKLSVKIVAKKRKQQVSFVTDRFDCKFKEGMLGFTLIESIVVITIISILLAIAVPTYSRFIQLAERRLCEVNRSVIERSYAAYLLTSKHTENVFNQNLIENFDQICLANGVICYVDGKANCSVHIDGNESVDNEQPGDGVPWL